MRGRCSWGRASLVLLLLLAPCAAAAPARVELRSSAPVLVSGDAAATLAGASGQWGAEDETADYVLTGVAGTLEVYEWPRWTSPAFPGVHLPVDESKTKRLALANATVRVALRDEFVLARFAAGPGASARVHGVSHGAGSPLWLERDVRSGAAFPVKLHPIPVVEWAWRAGDAFLGTGVDLQPRAGFPAWERATLRPEGPFRLDLLGGNVTVVEDGQEVLRARLGRWAEPEDAASPARRVETWAELILDATAVGDARVPLAAEWGLAGARVAWSVDGRMAWTRAEGEARTSAGPRRFEDADVVVTGALDVVPSGAAVASAVTPVAYAAEGDARLLVIGGETTTAEPQVPGAAVGTASLAAALLVALALLPKLAAAYYTRIAPQALMENATRRRLYARLLERPGLHLRELYRATGGAYGAFRFHLDLLRRAGFLRTERRGKYVLVYPTGVTLDPTSSIPHPVARSVYLALPEDGTPATPAELAGRVGVSRQLAGHHLKRLVAEGLVERSERRLRGPVFARTRLPR